VGDAQAGTSREGEGGGPRRFAGVGETFRRGGAGLSTKIVGGRSHESRTPISQNTILRQKTPCQVRVPAIEWVGRSPAQPLIVLVCPTPLPKKGPSKKSVLTIALQAQKQLLPLPQTDSALNLARGPFVTWG